MTTTLGLGLGLGLLLACSGCGDTGMPTSTGDAGSSDAGSSDAGSSDAGTTVDGTVAWTLDNHLTVCSAEGQWLCPRGQRDGSSSWEPIPCGVQDLDDVWGTTYQIHAALTGWDDTAVDGCGDLWTLRSVDSQDFDGADQSFELVGLYGVMITTTKTGGVLQGGHAFVCASAAVCADLASVVSDWAHVYTLSMRVGLAAGDPLVLDELAEI